jgi:DNA-binding FrmR family transcriptional regulator
MRLIVPDTIALIFPADTEAKTAEWNNLMLVDDEKKKILNRIKRINGQVEAVGRMIDNEEYCVDVLMQISAATGALAKVGQIVLENHLKTCVMEAMKNDDDADRDQKLEELIKLFRKYAGVID